MYRCHYGNQNIHPKVDTLISKSVVVITNGRLVLDDRQTRMVISSKETREAFVDFCQNFRLVKLLRPVELF